MICVFKNYHSIVHDTMPHNRSIEMLYLPMIISYFAAKQALELCLYPMAFAGVAAKAAMTKK